MSERMDKTLDALIAFGTALIALLIVIGLGAWAWKAVCG